MNKSKFYILIIIALLISNLLLVGNLLMGKKHRRHHIKPKNRVIQKLNFTPKQIAQYDKLIEDHRDFIEKSEAQILTLKEEMNQLLLAPDGQQKILEITSKIGSLQQQIESNYFNHFIDIKNICTADQKENFNELVLDISKIFKRQRGPKK